MTDINDYFALSDDLEFLKRRTVRGSLITGIGQVVRIAISFVSQLILGHLLLPKDFGLVAMVGPVTALLELLKDLGLSQSIISRERITREDVNSLYWVGLSASLIAAVVLAASSPLFALFYRQPLVVPIMMALSLQMPIAALAGHASALMARRMRYAEITLIDVGGAVVTLLAAAGSAFSGFGFWSLVVGTTAGAVFRACFDLVLSGWRPGRPRWSAGAGSMLRFGGQLTGFNIISYCSSYIDNIIVGALNGPAALGLFDRSFSLVLRPLGSITAPISKVAVPLLAQSRNCETAYRAAYLSLLQGLLLAGTPLLLVLVVFPSDIVGVILGARWLGMAPMFSAISAAAIFTPFSGSSYWLFASQDRAGEQVKTALFSSAAVIVAMLLGLPWGAVGIATCYALFAPVVHGSYSWIAGRRGPVRRKDILKAALPTLAFSVIILVCLQTLKSRVQPSLGRTAAAVLASYVIAFCSSLIFPGSRKLVLGSSRNLLLILRRK